LKEFNTERIRKRLDAVDWNFPGSTTPQYSVHTTHWFPGNFIPQIPSFLIQLLSQPGENVLDPFCGSGTTLIEALSLGRVSTASDINRASVHVTEGKAALVTGPHIIESLHEIQNNLLFDFPLNVERHAGESEDRTKLQAWFHPHTFDLLCTLWRQIADVKDTAAKRVLEMLFTDTLFACASPGMSLTKTGNRRRHHWGWIADNVIPKTKYSHDAIGLFRKRLSQALCVAEHSKQISKASFSISRDDATRLSLGDNSVDLVVTSPPYLGMIDYTLANRLTYEWMQWPLDEDIGKELGARRFRNRASALEDYLAAMKLATDEIYRVLKERGCCALVIGASRAFPSAVESVLKQFSIRFETLWGPTARMPTRRRVAERGGTEQKEFVCVFQKR
jgi:DNA modification methylase